MQECRHADNANNAGMQKYDIAGEGEGKNEKMKHKLG